MTTKTMQKDETSRPQLPTLSRASVSKLKRLARWLHGAKTVVWFTGAGISTESGMPDYRGPDGVWTRLEQGLAPPVVKESAVFHPNAAHHALVGFERIGKAAFLVSQNVDNLHIESGFPRKKLAELHGNNQRLACTTCETTYPTIDFRTEMGGRRRDDKGRFIADKCPGCAEKLKSSVVNFGDPLPRQALADSFSWARKADLTIVVGSTCGVTPAADVPRETKANGGKLVIMNIGKTKLDKQADLRFSDDKAGALLPKLLHIVEQLMGVQGKQPGQHTAKDLSKQPGIKEIRDPAFIRAALFGPSEGAVPPRY